MPPRFDGAIAAVATKIDAAVQPGPILWTSLVLGFAMIAWLRLSQPPPRRGLNRPPLAPGSVPLLGHALAFKKDPAGFLTACCEAVGPVFRLNMAGKRFVVVGPSRAAMAQVAMANESVLSARQAVMDVGFKETLGPLNVGVGTDLHKRAVKQAFGGEKLGDEAAPLLRALEAAFEQQLAAVAVVSDFVALVRRCVLRCVIERLFGTAVLRAAGESFLDAFMEFQDAVEDATAKAAVLPRRVALLLILAPVQARRAVVSGRLAAAIEAAWQGSEGWGPWLHTFRGDAVSAADAGEMGCGLLFAAHKNPAIAAAQAVLFVLETEARERAGVPTPFNRQRVEDAIEVRAEARAALARPTALLEPNRLTRRLALETCRVTAHTLGAVRTVLPREGFVLETAEASEGRDGRAVGRYWAAPGETIALSHIAVHRHAPTWGPDAACFRPGRPEWDAALPGHAEPTPDEYTHTTFSHGLHKCPGERLALLVVDATLAVLLGKYPLCLDRPLPAVSFERATLAQRDGPVRVCIRPP